MYPIYVYKLSMIHRVVLSKFAEKQLKKVPHFILNKLETWIHAVEIEGLERVRHITGYHDEPLKGTRSGQRSIRLNLAYRAIYVVEKNTVEFVNILEVNKHDY